MEKHRDQDPKPATPEVVVRGLRDFETFYRAEFHNVLGLVGVLSGSRWSEEMTQEAFLRAYRDWEAAFPDAPPGLLCIDTEAFRTQ